MNLISMKLNNYRRFVGEHFISFSNGEKNVTIIRSQNGAGKTGLLMALLFGLFGVVKYNQLRVDKDEDIIVSRPLLKNNQSAIATVTIEFNDDGKKYKIIRSVKAQNLNGVITQQNDNIESKLYIDGIDSNYDKSKIDEFMNGLVGENIRGFLFFDGVRYMELFQKDDNATKKELKEIIEKMLNIGDLDDTIEAIKFLETSFSQVNNGNRKLSAQLAEINNEIINLKVKIKKFEEENKEHEDRIKKYNDLFNQEMDKKKKYDDYKNVFKNINEVDGEIETIKNGINILKEKIKNFPNILSNSLKENYGLEVREEFLKISENELDNVALIQHILNVKECICGDKIDTKKESHLVNLLEHLDNKPRYSSTIIYKAKKVVEYIDTVSEGDFDSFTDLYNSYKSKVDKLNQCVIDRNNLLNQIPNDIDTDSVMNKSNNNIKSLGHLEALIEKEKEGYEKNENRISGLNEDLEKKKQEKEEKEEEIAMVNNQHDNYLFFKNTREKLQRLRNDYINEAQNNISERANEYFMELLSDDDKAAFNYLKINSNYKIEAYNNDGKEIFSQFSAGQKHLAAMAFTMGLTAVASNAKPTCNFPLVMDTPMSNLDLGNRERLIKLMPKVVSQWILTPMDTELTDKEIDFFEKTNKVGKVYRLNKQNELSYIEEFDDISKIKGELLNV